MQVINRYDFSEQFCSVNPHGFQNTFVVAKICFAKSRFKNKLKDVFTEHDWMTLGQFLLDFLFFLVSLAE